MEKILPSFLLPRLVYAIYQQRSRNMLCPTKTEGEGKVAFITGATNGIGKETAFGLLKRGFKIIVSGRDESKLNLLKEEIKSMGFDMRKVESVVLDLADLRTFFQLESRIKARQIDVLIENAGVWPNQYGQTKQGFEIAFGTNVLGHFALRKILQRKLLSSNAKIIIVTGDIYIMERDSKINFFYRTALGGLRAYSQSKLGNIWIGLELQRKEPNWTINMVHPGVVATDLVKSGTFNNKIKTKFLLSPEEGSQTSLFCATQTTTPGGYYHNTMGACQFKENDPALNTKLSSAYWDRVENIVKQYI